MKLFGAMEIESNELCIGGISCSDLVKEFGSPLYVMDENLLISTCKSYYDNFKCKENHNRVAYAGKAFLTKAMCKLVNEQGLYLDVVSGGELFTAYKAGFPLNKVYFHGNNKSRGEIELGVKLGVGRFVVDNLDEMKMLNEEAGKNNIKQDIYLRLTPGIEAHTHDYIKTGQIDSKFGFAPVGETIMNAVKLALDCENLNLKGLHCHIGSQIFETEPYKDAVEIMMNFMKEIKDQTGHIIPELDLGGGFGIHYTDEDKPRETKEYCEVILNKVDEVCSRLNIERPILTIEPGRSIVGNAGITLYTIGAIKNIEGVRTYVSVDGGMTDNIRPALYGAKYEMAIANKIDEKANTRVAIAGKCCESGDIFIEDICIQKPEIGDILAVFSTGAYGFSMSSNYNKNPKAPVVFIKDGVVRLVSKRQSYEELLELEV
ncbi:MULTISPECIES: diaminopimelate decarboxylase [Clostridium]|uniref:diaminopimelate decarboxylase n=1 Tax=Clostridium TaxID=1485 RepID=UPI001C8B7299|nr:MULTISPECIES: diaminopimelate decarboxylase [Clostridium]MBX9184164.1 diaminopimelate decarboxylase [Clostridium sp. K04]MDU3520787.1 diaminopimelate decarboxylase [Clostridium saudiense]